MGVEGESEPLGDFELLIEEWTDSVMNVNAISDRASETCGSINQSLAINYQSIKMKKNGNMGVSTDHIDEVLEGDGRRPTGSVVVVTAAATAAAPVVLLVLVDLLLQVKFLLQLLDLVRLNVLTKFRRPQGAAEILPRNLSETFRIELRRRKKQNK